MAGTVITLDRAVELARTGDVWVFRGSSGTDRAIRSLTNAPVNHVGMAVVIDDLPALMWHAELGRSLPDIWSGTHQRGVQLHDLRAAVLQWGHRYGQHGWLRQLEGVLETAYCAEVVAVTYEEMGLLPRQRRPNWYDPGRFWSGDDLELRGCFRLDGEIAVELPPTLRS